VYTPACVFVFFSSLLGGVVVGHNCHLVCLVAFDVCRALSMDSLIYDRHFYCA
jgi:hypothetical protein